MSRRKRSFHNTDLDVLVTSLRSEVGDIIFTWTVMRDLLVQTEHRRQQLGDKSLGDAQYTTVRAVAEKLEDEIVARLSELAEPKVGRVDFFFATQKLGALGEEVKSFQKFVKDNGFKDKRNSEISHKESPQQWSDSRRIHIPYAAIVRGIAMALRLMKKVDGIVSGREATYFWRRLREGRYERTMPAEIQYMLGPYMKLTRAERLEIVKSEVEKGTAKWEPVETALDGKAVTLPAIKKWGAILLGDRVVFLDQYPLIGIYSMNTTQDGEPQGPADVQEDGEGDHQES